MKKGTIVISLVVILSLLVISIYMYNNQNKEDIVTYNYDYNTVKKEVIDKITMMSADELLIELYDKDITVNNIGNDLILKGILLSLDSDGESTDDEIDAICDKNDICINNEYINKSTVDKYINDIYGDIKYDSSIDNLYYYDVDNKKYYEYCTNDINENLFIETYIADVNLDLNILTVEIFVAFGIEDQVLKNGEYVSKVSIYKDKQLNDKYYDYTYTLNKPKMFELDESNYKEFSKYVYTFIDNGEGFKFNSLKKE